MPSYRITKLEGEELYRVERRESGWFPFRPWVHIWPAGPTRRRHFGTREEAEAFKAQEEAHDAWCRRRWLPVSGGVDPTQD